MPKAYLHFAFSILHSALNYFSFFYFNRFSQLGKPAGLAAGDEHLSRNDLIQYKILPSLIQLRQNVIQQKNRLFAPFSCHQLPLGKFQGNGRRPGLTLRAVGLQVDENKAELAVSGVPRDTRNRRGKLGGPSSKPKYYLMTDSGAVP